MSDRTHYEVIGADPGAAKGDLKAAYTAALQAAQEAGDTEEVARVRRAWQVLSDPVQRQRYDDQIGVGHRGAAALGEPGAPEGPSDDHDAVPGPDVEVLDEHAAYARAGAIGPTGVPAALEQPTLGRRLTASFIDVITFLAVFLVSSTITAQITGVDHGVPALAITVGWLEFWILALIVIPTIRTGQTLGKRLTYIMTVDRLSGNLPTVGQVVRRYVVPAVMMPLVIPLGAYLSLFFALSYAMGRDQQSLADRLARTIVVVARYRPARAGSSA